MKSLLVFGLGFFHESRADFESMEITVSVILFWIYVRPCFMTYDLASNISVTDGSVHIVVRSLSHIVSYRYDLYSRPICEYFCKHLYMVFSIVKNCIS